MTFDQLKNIFGNAAYLELKSEEVIPPSSGLKGSFVKIDKRGSDYIYVRKVNDTAENGMSEGFLCKSVNKQNEAVLDRLLRGFCLARTDEVAKKTIKLEILPVEHPNKFDEPFAIALADSSLSLNETAQFFERKIKKEYAFEYNKKAYYVLAKHVHTGEKNFSLINGDKLIDIVYKRRGDIDSYAGDNADDRVYAVVNGEKNYNKDDYSISLVEADLHFNDITTAAAASRMNAAFISSELERYISIWNNVCDLEYGYVTEQKSKAGMLPYEKLREIESDIVIKIKTEDEQIENFIKILFELNNSSSDLRVELSGELSFGKKREIKSSTLQFARAEGSIVYCRRLPDSEKYRIPENGEISVSIAGFERQYMRRKDAINRIVSGKSAKPNLAMLLSGEGAIDSFREYIPADGGDLREVCFGGNDPQPAQLQAIECALNTPDFVIIQGPPGTGKTRVINAIQHRIAQVDGEKTIQFGKNLLTAYQRETTRNLAEKTEMYGLPTPSILGQSNAEREILEKQFIEWHKNMCRRLKELHPNLVENVEHDKAKQDFFEVLARYDVSTYTYEKNESELKYLIKTLHDYLSEEQISALQEFLEQAQNRLKRLQSTVLTTEFNIAKNIPTGPVSYEDGGADLIKKIVSQLDETDGVQEAVRLLGKYFNECPIDFEKVKCLKDEILSRLLPQHNLIIPKVFNERVYALLCKIRDGIIDGEQTQEELIIGEYLEAFLYDEVQILSAIDKFQTVIAATHQKAVDSEIKIKKNILESDLVYENVLVDEAARSCPPDLFIPLSCARDRIILVGDHKQLPQFVSDKIYDIVESQEGKTAETIAEERAVIEQTMFRRLIDEAKKLKAQDQKPRFITLDTQYRMKEVLGDFVSRNFYEPEVKIKSVLPDSEFTHTLPGIENKSMVWLDVKGKEKSIPSGGYTRGVEASAIAKYLKKVIASSAWVDTQMTFGIISFYREQLNAIKKALSDPGIGICEETDSGYKIKKEYEKQLKIDTVDAFQGLECDIVILSTTRSNKDGKFGFIENDRKKVLRSLNGVNRLCVALSRQKRCLIIAGDGSMMKREGAKDRAPALYNFYTVCMKGGKEVAVLRNE